MDLPHIKSSCGTQSKISNPMGIGCGMDYVRCRNIQKSIRPHIKLSCATQIQCPIIWVQGCELTMSLGGISKNGFCPHQIFMWDTKENFQSYGHTVRNGLSLLEKYAKMDPHHIKSYSGTENTISTPMAIGLGIDYVTWSNMEKWIPTTSNLHIGHITKSSILLS